MNYHVINLDRRPDRWAAFQEQARQAGISASRISAIDAQSSEFEELKHTVQRSWLGEITNNGTVACTLSHRKTMKLILESPEDAEFHCILEDDAILSKTFRQGISALKAANLCGFNLIKIEYSTTMKQGIVSDAFQELDKHFSISRSRHFLNGSAGYVIRREFAQTVLERSASSAAPIDHFLFYPSKNKSHLGEPYAILTPSIVRQDWESASDISTSGLRATKKRSIFAAVRRGTYEVAQVGQMLNSFVLGTAKLRKLDYDI